ncbi:hypothetical protein [Hespellia stercorisuis]|uniref:Uncharacterized protein n=1 Tax=Hespellia stercorisuis DSM 15480 TaxID=1121950 RepID=A0A1M6RM17_9FIRM|nr:hypothetical protein [Hespellia stercorisuis]SHK33513.1 hypothetical protein SAMN02745243_02731 [Hespellia stercorisuis DSM 15480]
MEVYDLMEAYYRRQEAHIKRSIVHDFVMAEVQTRYMFRKDDAELPHVWEYYPALFTEEEKAYVELKEIEDLEACKNSRRKFASEINRARREF